MIFANNSLKVDNQSAKTASITSQKSTINQVKNTHYTKSIINQSNNGPSKKSSSMY